jgi:nanoRNase/pAp phosphatase (c-di-AMP/oligoRNAs hydrolase)
MMSRVKDLEEVLESCRGKKILIALRGHPDPDSISCALAHKELMKRHDIQTTIMYNQEMSHQENRALVKLLGLDFVRYDGNNLNVEGYVGYSLVDSQLPDNEILENLKTIPVISIVDHHDEVKGIEARFIDLDKEAGASATTYSHYLSELDLLKEGDEGNSELATALIHGIRSDTDALINAWKKDYEAITYLSRFADLELLRKISIQPLSHQTMDLIVRAYLNREISDNYLITGVDIVRKVERDSIPQAADFLLRRSGIDTVLVYGIVDDYIDCSFRTLSDIIRPSDFIKEAFPDVKEGQYGGRYDKGGFQLPLGIFASLAKKSEESKSLINVVNDYMRSRFYEKLGIVIEKKNGD